MLRNSVVIAIVRTRSQAIPLAMITMRKSTHVFPVVSHMSMGLRLADLWAAGAPLKKFDLNFPCICPVIYTEFHHSIVKVVYYCLMDPQIL